MNQDFEIRKYDMETEKTIKEETINQKKLKLIGFITELEREMRQLENKIEEIKSIVYHL